MGTKRKMKYEKQQYVMVAEISTLQEKEISQRIRLTVGKFVKPMAEGH